MRTLRLLLIVLGLTTPVAYAQQAAPAEGARIESAEVLGIPFDQLSPGLRQDIDALAGTPFSPPHVDGLASRIEMEHPDVIAAVRSLPREDGAVHVVLLVARIDDDEALRSNINARYTIESVAIAGVPDSQVSQALRDAMQGLVGKRLDPDEGERLEERLAAELPDFEVKRRVSRGSTPGRVRLVFEVNEVGPQPWIPFIPSRSKFVYHELEGWSGVLDVPMGGRTFRVNAGAVFGNDDDLVEEYSGFRLRVESRTLGTGRLGASVELSSLHETWRPETLSAVALDPAIPEAYRSRVTVEPTVTFAFSPHARVSAGVSVSELESLSRSPDSQMASAVLFSVGYDQQWMRAGGRHSLDAVYQLRAATSGLDSDLTYTRQFGSVGYRFAHRRTRVRALFSFGYIDDRAPLFERFTLGDSSTLRGWNKYDIAPAGGDRMFHQTVEYSYRHLAIFLDAGSVWEQNGERRLRYSTGFGFTGENAFITLGVPLNADSVSTTFLMGVRF